jgi:hypothetical protein
MREMFRDKSRDDMAESLNSSGVEAEMAGRGRSEEGIRSGSILLRPFGQQSLGLIDILDGGLILWINVVRVKRRDRHSGPRYRAVLGIPDENIPMNHKQLRIKTVRKKSFPVFGQVTDVYWEGKGNLQPLVKVFSDDVDIDNVVTDLGNMSVYTHPNKFQGWTLELGRMFVPTESRWATFQKIANYLLSSHRS